MPRVRVLSTLLTLLTLFALPLVVSCGGDGARRDREAPPEPAPEVCVAGELTLPDGRCQPAGLPLDMACPPGERALPDGRCQPAGLPPDMACPPGERALPDGRCQPAGVPAEACATGRFVPDGRGGCAPILPEEICPEGFMAVPGERACREVSPCGEGTWGNIPAAGNTQYVDRSYPGDDSDGSRQRPWTTVQAGVDAAAPGAIVAVAEGRYQEDVLITDKPVRLWGRCPARTEVAGLGARAGAISLAREGASGAEVRGLAVTGPEAGVFVQGARRVVLAELWVHDATNAGVVAVERAGVTLSGALLEQNRVFGVYLEGAELTASATAVRATEPDGARRNGVGIAVLANPDTGEGSQLSLTASLIEQSHRTGVHISGSDVRAFATVVRATQPDGAGNSGVGLLVLASAATGQRGRLSLTASLVEQNHEIGVAVGGADATVENTVVRATQPNGAGRYGRGLVVQADPSSGEGGKLSLKDSLVEQNHEAGVIVYGSDVTVEGTVVRATQPLGTGEGGEGIFVEAYPTTGKRSHLSLSSSLIEQNHEIGVLIGGSEATIETTVVRETQSDGAGNYGSGIVVHPSTASGERGNLSLRDSLVEQNHEAGVYVSGSDATIETTVVRETRPNGAGEAGWGVWVRLDEITGEKGKLSLAGALIEQNRAIGMAIFGSEVTAFATVVRATQLDDAEETGWGISVMRDAFTGESGKVWLTASLVEQNHEFGVSLANSEATIESSVVRATQPNGAGEFGWGVFGSRTGADMAEGSKLWLTTSLVEQNHEAGVIVFGSEATLQSTAVRATTKASMGDAFGDGILVVDHPGPSKMVLLATESTDNARAGVIFVGASGELTGVRSSGNRFGLVLQPGRTGAEPVVGEGNAFEGNTERDRLVGGDLPVPDAPPPVP